MILARHGAGSHYEVYRFSPATLWHPLLKTTKMATTAWAAAVALNITRNTRADVQYSLTSDPDKWVRAKKSCGIIIGHSNIILTQDLSPESNVSTTADFEQKTSYSKRYNACGPTFIIVTLIGIRSDAVKTHVTGDFTQACQLPLYKISHREDVSGLRLKFKLSYTKPKFNHKKFLMEDAESSPPGGSAASNAEKDTAAQET